MAKTIIVKLANRDPEQLVTRARSLAGENGLHFAGDSSAGHFHGRGLEGRYHFSAQALQITILRKPLILPWSLVEMTVSQYFV